MIMHRPLFISGIFLLATFSFACKASESGIELTTIESFEESLRTVFKEGEEMSFVSFVRFLECVARIERMDPDVRRIRYGQADTFLKAALAQNPQLKDLEGPSGMSPLHCAVTKGLLPVLILAHNGFRLNDLDNDGRTAFDRAIDSRNYRVIDCLRDVGARAHVHSQPPQERQAHIPYTVRIGGCFIVVALLHEGEDPLVALLRRFAQL